MDCEILCHNLHVSIRAEDAISDGVVRRLKALLPTYVNESKGGAMSAFFEIKYVPERLTHPFPSDPIRVSTSHLKWFKEEENGDFTAIGFLNGVLLFSWGARKAKCLLFSDEEGVDFLTGSAHRLLFVAFCLWAAEHGQFLVHCAAVNKENRGYFFWGPSGAGKSTISGFFSSEEVLSDEAPLVYREGGVFFVARTPFRQHTLKDNHPISPSARAVKNYFLNKSDRFSIARRDRRAALAEIVKAHIHGFYFMTPHLKGKAFNFFADFCLDVPSFDLTFPLAVNISDLIN